MTLEIDCDAGCVTANGPIEHSPFLCARIETTRSSLVADCLRPRIVELMAMSIEQLMALHIEQLKKEFK